METAIITLTKGGMNLGLKLLGYLDNTHLYISSKFRQKTSNSNIIFFEEGIKALTKDIFHQYQCLVFIMATGIVVRSIAPLVDDKKYDPAVVVLDEKGKNVISLLSGHLGRANEYTVRIAGLLNSNPVITTASDVNNSLAVDTLAMELNCKIDDFLMARKVTAHIVNEERILIKSDIPMELKLPDNINVVDCLNSSEKYKGAIIITEKKISNGLPQDTVFLRPKNIIVGVGCRRGTTAENILEAIKDSLESMDLSIKSLKHLATIDIKKNEVGLCDAARLLGVPLVAIPSSDILKVEGNYQSSSFVKASIGVGAVCEPAALLSSKNGTIISKKKKYTGITIAIVREGDI